jgi:2-amino-4-hydroxy-6-hydroxymethyldihydropteridine diphosphokinase
LVTCAVALGSNLGDRQAHLDHAVNSLRTLLSNLVVSTYRDTVPVGVVGPHSLFLNAAATGETRLPLRALLEALLVIERERGRERPHPNAPRTLDLDLILFGDAMVDEPGLTVPHPRFRDRRFVLEPLSEIAPALRDPVTGRTVRELLTQLVNG